MGNNELIIGITNPITNAYTVAPTVGRTLNLILLSFLNSIW